MNSERQGIHSKRLSNTAAAMTTNASRFIPTPVSSTTLPASESKSSSSSASLPVGGGSLCLLAALLTRDRKSHRDVSQMSPSSRAVVAEAFSDMGYAVQDTPKLRGRSIALLPANPLGTSFKACGGAVGLSFSAGLDSKASALDRRFLSRTCLIARQAGSLEKAIEDIVKAVGPYNPCADGASRLGRAEMLREAGRALVREYPEALRGLKVTVAYIIFEHTQKPFDVAALIHGATLELRQQGLWSSIDMFTPFGKRTTLSQAATSGAVMTAALNNVPNCVSTFATVPLDQALLLLSSIRFHTAATEREIDECADALRTRADMCTQARQLVDRITPRPGVFKSEGMRALALLHTDDQETVEGLVEGTLANAGGGLTPALFLAAGELYVQGPLPADPDRLVEADFATRPATRHDDARQRTLDFYSLYASSCLKPLEEAAALTQGGLLGTQMELLASHLCIHEDILAKEVQDIEQRSYVRSALATCKGDKAVLLAELRAVPSGMLERIRKLM